MKKIFIVIGFCLLSSLFVHGQARSQEDVEKARAQAKEERFNNRIDALRNNGKQVIIRDRYKKDKIFLEFIRPRYRDLFDSEKSLLAPEQEDITKYADFLSNKNTGLIKLMIDRGCDKGADIVVAESQCENYRMPGAGSSYSFRSKLYRNKDLADITFVGENFDTLGLIKHGILVNIGDIPLNKVDLNTKQIETLVTFTPVTDYEKAAGFSGILQKGVKADDLIFGSLIKVEENKTYALRSIAYRTKYYKEVEETIYDEFDFDERDDVIIAFRVVRLNPGESVTILWKELKNKNAPKMEFSNIK